MAEAADDVAGPHPCADRALERPLPAARRSRRDLGAETGDHRFDADAGSAMPEALERGEPRDDDGVWRRTGGGDTARREGRDVELVVGAEDQRRAEDLGAVRPRLPGPRELLVNRLDTSLTCATRAGGGSVFTIRFPAELLVDVG